MHYRKNCAWLLDYRLANQKINLSKKPLSASNNLCASNTIRMMINCKKYDSTQLITGACLLNDSSNGQWWNKFYDLGVLQTYCETVNYNLQSRILQSVIVSSSLFFDGIFQVCRIKFRYKT